MPQVEFVFPKCEYSTSCPLNKSCNRLSTEINHADTDENDPVDVLFIGDHATAPDLKARRPFNEQSPVLRPLIQKVIPNRPFAMGYIVRGWPVDRSTLPSHMVDKFLGWDAIPEDARTHFFADHPQKDHAINECLPLLINDIKRIRPKLIVMFGATVLKALFPRESRSTSALLNETLFYMGIPTRVISHPTAVLRNPAMKDGWEKSLATILTGVKSTKITESGPFTILKTVSEVKEFIETIQNTPNDIAVDTETKNLNKKNGNALACIQFSETPKSSVIIPYAHPETPFGPSELDHVRGLLFDLFSRPSMIRHWICHNAKFECNIFHSTIGTQILSAPIYDTQIGAHLLDENRKDRSVEFKYGIYTLKQLAYDYNNFDGYDMGILATRAEGNLWDLALGKLCEYGAIDTQQTFALYINELEAAQRQNFKPQLLKLMYHLYTPLIRLFSDIERNGFYVNLPYIRTLVSPRSPILTRIEEILKGLRTNPSAIRANDILLGGGQKHKVVPLGIKPWIFDYAKQGHPQLLFFDILGLSPLRVGKSGLASVDAAWQENNEANAAVKDFMEWSELRKMYDTFAKQIYGFIDPVSGSEDCNKDSRVRSNFLLASTVTGRVACNSPNIHAVPRGDTVAKKMIKNLFQAPEGMIMAQADYRANEIRWVGILSQDEKLAIAILEGEKAFAEYRKNPSKALLERAETYGDIHKQVGSMIFGIPLESVTKDQRQASKVVSFGLLYDSSIKAIATKFDRSIEEVQEWFNLYYSKFPRVREWKFKMKEMAKAAGYVEAPHGRRRRFPIFDLYRRNGRYDEDCVPYEFRGATAEALRQSSNAPVQGIASDFSMLGSAIFAEEIRNQNLPIYIENAVHDSCIFLTTADFLEKALELAEDCFLRRAMEHGSQIWDINFNLPLGVDFEIGTKWGELTRWNFAPSELAEIKSNILKERS